MLLGTALRQFKGKFQDTVDADTGHHRFLQHNLPLCARKHLASDTGVLTLGVFPHHIEINVAWLASG